MFAAAENSRRRSWENERLSSELMLIIELGDLRGARVRLGHFLGSRLLWASCLALGFFVIKFSLEDFFLQRFNLQLLYFFYF